MNAKNEKEATMDDVRLFADWLYQATVDASVVSAKARLQDDTDTLYLASVFDGLTHSLASWHLTIEEAIAACDDVEEEVMVADFEQVAQEINAMDDPEPSLNEFDIAELFAQDERSMTQIANDAGLTSDTVKRFVEGAGKPRNKTLRGLEKAFNMKEGTLDVFA